MPLFIPLSRFPPVREDLSILVDATMPAGAVEAIVRLQLMVESALLFDLYTGPGIPDGKKALGYAITWRATDHTLTKAEVAGLRAQLIQQLADHAGAVVRANEKRGVL